jgi:glycerophosphoryl diester phosphodiesterase
LEEDVLKTQVFAHRGASEKAPENTLAAFELAAEMGADGIELDVHLSRDGRLMVLHDDTVDRTSSGTGTVHDMLCDELRALDVSMGIQGFSGARIPTLDEVYALIKKTGMTVNVELKENCYENGFLVIPKALELAEQYGLVGRVFYSSFNHYLLREMKQSAKAVQTAVLYDAAMVDVWDYTQKVPADAIHPYFQVLQDRQLVPQCHARGIAVRPWTVDREEELTQMFAAGVDTVITNRPDLALQLRG